MSVHYGRDTGTCTTSLTEHHRDGPRQSQEALGAAKLEGGDQVNPPNRAQPKPVNTQASVVAIDVIEPESRGNRVTSRPSECQATMHNPNLFSSQPPWFRSKIEPESRNKRGSGRQRSCKATPGRTQPLRSDQWFHQSGGDQSAKTARPENLCRQILKKTHIFFFCNCI